MSGILKAEDAVLFAAATGAAGQAVGRAKHLLDLIERQDDPIGILTARIAPDMMNCAGQIRTTAGFALRSTFPLTGRTAPVAAFSDDLRGLQSFLSFAGAEVDALTELDFAGAAGRQIAHRAGAADLVQDASDYVHLFALPNLWFHLSMAYAILRNRGVPVGKKDFDGWHIYPGPAITRG